MNCSVHEFIMIFCKILDNVLLKAGALWYFQLVNARLIEHNVNMSYRDFCDNMKLLVEDGLFTEEDFCNAPAYRVKDKGEQWLNIR